MASSMSLTFLRPMGLPRPSTINRFLGVGRISTATASKSVSKPPPPSPKPTKATNSSPPSGISSIETKVYTYRITRTPSNNYPIYAMAKRGGNMKLTKIRRIEGDVNAFRRDLMIGLGLGEEEVVINQLTRHVIVKVWTQDKGDSGVFGGKEVIDYGLEWHGCTILWQWYCCHRGGRWRGGWMEEGSGGWGEMWLVVVNGSSTPMV
ncbi:uncharacterized protein PAC_14159 [Phialocephala subalpina]|uniref:Large ribosomal subunit protein mL49 n=1 Tax=Phialocephala subalpina TaxID=576137 RepID=A0A1L7XGV5_9HELO|nr:uncharacterized protein PAC_14159 [Phialocephala subalpina]